MRTMALPRILVIDNEPQLIETITFVLSDRYGVEGFYSGRSALAAAEKELFPVAIVDLRMDDMDGIAVLRALKAVSPFTQVIILTAHACLDSAMDAINRGAFRYLTKPFERTPFLDAISEAMSAYEGALLAQDRLRVAHIHLENIGLSPRLAEVAQGILEGKSNDEIAQNLNIAPRTVEKHVERLLAHFGISSRFLLEARVLKLLRQLASGSALSMLGTGFALTVRQAPLLLAG